MQLLFLFESQNNQLSAVKIQASESLYLANLLNCMSDQLS